MQISSSCKVIKAHKTQEEILSVVNEFKERDIPLSCQDSFILIHGLDPTPYSFSYGLSRPHHPFY